MPASFAAICASAQRARDVLREIPCADLVKAVQKASELYMKSDLPLGDGTQTPDDFVRQQSATTGLPEHMCRKNMEKIAFVLSQMDRILDSLTRGLDLSILTAGYGRDPQGRLLSYQAQTNVLGMVLPSNSPGVHTLWMPVVPMQIGLVLKPGPQEPWTPYRMATGDVSERRSDAKRSRIYPGGMEAGMAVLETCRPHDAVRQPGDRRSARRESADSGPRPGYSKDFDRRRQGRSVGELSRSDGKQRSAQQRAQLHQLLGDLCFAAWPRRSLRLSRGGSGKVQPLAPEDPKAPLAAFTVAGVAEAISASIDEDLKADGAEDMTAAVRNGSRAITREHVRYLLPTVVYCESPEVPIAKKEFMFPFVNVVECPQDEDAGEDRADVGL